jgi:hypothetical protein
MILLTPAESPGKLTPGRSTQYIASSARHSGKSEKTHTHLLASGATTFHGQFSVPFRHHNTVVEVALAGGSCGDFHTVTTFILKVGPAQHEQGIKYSRKSHQETKDSPNLNVLDVQSLVRVGPQVSYDCIDFLDFQIVVMRERLQASYSHDHKVEG